MCYTSCFNLLLISARFSRIRRFFFFSFVTVRDIPSRFYLTRCCRIVLKKKKKINSEKPVAKMETKIMATLKCSGTWLNTLISVRVLDMLQSYSYVQQGDKNQRKKKKIKKCLRFVRGLVEENFAILRMGVFFFPNEVSLVLRTAEPNWTRFPSLLLDLQLCIII